MATWQQRYKDDDLLFLEAGFIAVNQQDEGTALELFKAAELLRPDHPMVALGFGYLHLHRSEIVLAGKYFSRAVELDPDNEMAQALFGTSLALLVDTQERGAAILEETCQSKDPSVQALSEEILALTKQAAKKPSPLEITPKRRKSP